MKSSVQQTSYPTFYLYSIGPLNIIWRILKVIPRQLYLKIILRKALMRLCTSTMATIYNSWMALRSYRSKLHATLIPSRKACCPKPSRSFWIPRNWRPEGTTLLAVYCLTACNALSGHNTVEDANLNKAHDPPRPDEDIVLTPILTPPSTTRTLKSMRQEGLRKIKSVIDYNTFSESRQ